MTLNQTTAREVKNLSWSVRDVHSQYSYSNPHADLYRYLSQWSDMESYYQCQLFRPGQFHLHVNSHLRLINRLADGLLALHTIGPHLCDRRLLDVAAGRAGSYSRPAQVWFRGYRRRYYPYNAQRANQMPKRKRLG
jgi:hypothetical protein